MAKSAVLLVICAPASVRLIAFLFRLQKMAIIAVILNIFASIFLAAFTVVFAKKLVPPMLFS